MKKTFSCPICISKEFDEFLVRNSIPIHQNWPTETKEDAIKISRGDLNLVRCKNCGFISNSKFEPEKLIYGKGYENAQNYSSYFKKYLLELVDYLIEEKNIQNSTILEIGCGNGFFLKELVANPSWNNFGIGFDPSYDGPKNLKNPHIVNNYFDPRHIHKPIDVVISRHVIQHISQPVHFLKKIRNLFKINSKAKIFLETPNVDWSIKNKTIWDYSFEQCSYFSKNTLALALNNAGFEVTKIREIFEKQYLWAECIPSTNKINQNKLIYKKLQIKNFSNELEDTLNHWKNKINEIAKKGNVCFWGAGAKGATLANLVDPDCSKIDCIVDLNPNKWGKYIAGTGHVIVSPEELKKRKINFAVVMNPNYFDEITAFLKNKHLDIKSII